MGVQKPLGKVHRQVKVCSLSRNQFRLLEGICIHIYMASEEKYSNNALKIPKKDG